MLRWAFTLSGLIIWAVHFLGAYAIASLADVVSRADHPAWRLGVIGFSVVCALGALGALLVALRRLARRGQDEPARFMTQLSALGAGLAVIAIFWQTLPAL